MQRQQRIGKTATTIGHEGGATVLRYHSTPVVRYDGHTVTLNSGGWRTATTKTRMNQASNEWGLGYLVYQEDFEWFVRLPDGAVQSFYDGMEFRA